MSRLWLTVAMVMGMWIELHDTMLDHRKVRRMARDLGLPHAHLRGHLVTLWLNVLRHAADGNLADWTSEDIADYAEWTGDAGSFVSALIKHEWLLDQGETIEVNDWREYAGHLKSAERKAADRLRKQQERAARKATQNEPRPQDVQGRPRTDLEIRSDRTGPDRTGPDQTGPDIPRPGVRGTVVDAPPVESEAEHATGADDIRAVFAHYRTHHPKAHPKPKSTSKEWRLIRDRLAEGHSLDDLKQAVDGIHLSPFHCGENDRGTKYQDLKLAMRDGDQVNKLRGIAEQYANGPPPVLTETTRRNLRAADRWASRGQQQEEPDAGL